MNKDLSRWAQDTYGPPLYIIKRYKKIYGPCPSRFHLIRYTLWHHGLSIYTKAYKQGKEQAFFEILSTPNIIKPEVVERYKLQKLREELNKK